MRHGLFLRLSKITSVFVALSVLFAPAASATSPYFKVYGGDVWAGGWFTQSGSCNTASGSGSSDYQDPLFTNASYGQDNKYGGILAYSTNNSGILTGASGQYGVFSLGAVDGNGSGNGFYSDSAISSGTKKLTFANNDPNYALGGAFQYSLSSGSQVRQSHCIPDYYGKLPSKTTSLTAGFSGSPSTDVYSATGTSGAPFNVTAGVVTVARGTQITLFVNGPAYIDKNIVYDLNTINDVPKFTLVVKGSLYIAPNVTQLDGLYIAEPDSSLSLANQIDSDTGIVWTCHPANDTSSSLQGTWISSNCGNQLIINGALIAKEVNFLRTNGDVGSAPAGEGPASSNIAEVINYTPWMVVGGPFFNPQPSATLKIESLTSLPPVF